MVDTLIDTPSSRQSSDRVSDVAIVHDYLTQRGGAERVVLAMSRAFPSATIHTSLYEADATYPEFGERRIDTSHLQRFPMLRRHHRAALLLYPQVFGRLKVDADVVICSTSGWAHGVSTDGAKLLYVHNPARWLYQADEYMEGAPRWRRAVLGALHRPMRHWDHKSAHSADRVLANSRVVRDRIRQHWGVDATVVNPPHGVDPDGPQEPIEGLEPGFLLCVARLMPYKHVGAIVTAMRTLTDDQLVVVGEGPLWHELEHDAPSSVHFMSRLSDGQLRWLYANARFLVAAAIDDFGLAPVEAMAFGTPSVAIRAAGYLETVIEGETGVFFDRPEPSNIVAAVREADRMVWGEARIRGHADLYSEASFATNMQAVVSDMA